MFDFSQIEEIRLSGGVHESAADGVCFMEAIAFFAGERHSDHPECASPALTHYGIQLNDRMQDDVRDRLLRPLVPMVAGTRDDANEQRRAEFLAMWAVNRVLPVILREHGCADHAARCERARTLKEALAAAYAALAAAYAAAERIWSLAVDGLRQAVLIGRHDGFTDGHEILADRFAKLRELAS